MEDTTGDEHEQKEFLDPALRKEMETVPGEEALEMSSAAGLTTIGRSGPTTPATQPRR